MKTKNQKFKGLINGKEWKAGALELYENDLTAILGNGKRVYVFKDSVSRFTGYTNALGEEIYEGDLLATNSDSEVGISVVFWDKMSHQWILSISHTYDADINSPLENHLDLSIIGHSFTHCHLLEPSTHQYELN